ncbi:MAG: cytochrome c peroxidase, partial [Polyangiales bacterium]
MTRRVRNGWGVGLIAALSCSGSSVEGPPLSDSLALGGLVLTNAAGEPQPLADYRRDEAGVLVVRVMTSWCGPCGWHAEHTRALVPDSQVPVRVIDVLLAGPDNTAPSTEDVERWQARSGEVATVLTDSDQQLERLLPARAALPLVAVLDANTLRAHHDVLPDAASGWLSAPGPALLRDTIAALQAALVGRPAPLRTAAMLHDDRFSDDVWDAIRSLQLPAAAPPDSSNRYADDPAAITLGERLFFAGELTPSERSVSCASCHMPELAFQDGKDQPPEGVGVGSRNVPTI